MPSRAQLEVQATAAGIDPRAYPNDSRLEQKVVNAQRTAAVTTGAKATGTLTSTGVLPTDGDTVTIGSKVYTLKTILTSTPNQVLIGASAAISLDNLKSAINDTGVEGTAYSTGTEAHTQVTATTNTDTTQVVEAIEAGTAGNSLASTETAVTLSWGGATLSGGTASTGASTSWQLSGGAA